MHHYRRNPHPPYHQWVPPHTPRPMFQQPFSGGGQQVPMPHAQMAHMERQISIEDAIGIARRQMEGQVVSAELERKSGRLIYEVEVISTEGPKYEIEIDAQTGEVIEIELD